MTESRRQALALILVLMCSQGLVQSAAAQQSVNRLTAQQNEQWVQQQAADQQAIARQNELSAQDAKAQTEARLRELQAAKPTLPAGDPVYSATPLREPVPLDQLSLDFPSIPDKELAASRARILAAAANRR